MHNSKKSPCRRRRIAFHLATKVSTGKVVTRSPSALESTGRESEGLLASPLGAQPASLCPEEAVGCRLRWNGEPRPIGCGLRNLGNTCFLNAVLQSLAYVPPLAQLLLPDSGSSSSAELAWGAGGNSRGGHVLNFVEMLRAVFVGIHGFGNQPTSSHSGSAGPLPGVGGHAISPEPFVVNLAAIGRQFRRGRQEDAHEFLLQLLDALQRQCLRSAGLPSLMNSSQLSDQRLAQTTAVHRIFGGKLRSRLRCMQCGTSRDGQEPFLDLSLSVGGWSKGKKKKAKKNKQQGAFDRFGGASGGSCSSQFSLQDALEDFLAVEQLKDSNSWRCPKCDAFVPAEKQLSISQAPNVCAVSLKRFVRRSDRSLQKLGEHVAFAESLRLPVIEIDHAASGDDAAGSVDYRLCSILVHTGASVYSGHYESFVRSSAGAWYRIDDETISLVKRSTVLEQPAYMLFYTRGQSRDGAQTGAQEEQKGLTTGNRTPFDAPDKKEDVAWKTAATAPMESVTSHASRESESGTSEEEDEPLDRESEEESEDEEEEEEEESEEDADDKDTDDEHDTEDDEDSEEDNEDSGEVGQDDASNKALLGNETQPAARRTLDPKRGFVIDVSTRASAVSGSVVARPARHRLGSTNASNPYGDAAVESWSGDEAEPSGSSSGHKRRSPFERAAESKHRYDDWDAVLDRGKTKKIGKAARRAEAAEMARIDQERGINRFQQAAEERLKLSKVQDTQGGGTYERSEKGDRGGGKKRSNSSKAQSSFKAKKGNHAKQTKKAKRF